MAKPGKDGIIPLDLIELIWLRKGSKPKPTPDQEKIIQSFFDYMMENFQAGPDQLRSIPIKSIMQGLGKTCTNLQDQYPKEIIRIALRDQYALAGIFVTHSGDIRFNVI